MVNQARFVRIALVFSGTLTVSMGLIALPAFSQVSSQAQLSETDMPARTEPAILSAPEATAEIATETVLDVTSILDKNDLEQAAALPVEALAIEPVIEPIAEMTGELTAAESETAMIEVAEALKSDIAEMQATAASTLSSEAEVTDPSAQALTPALTPDEIDSATVADALPAIAIENDSAAIASLLEAASLGSGLGVIEADSVPALKAALNSDNAFTRLYAADALWTLTSDRDLILPTLISVAAGGNLQTRELATAAIGYLGRQALPAIPFLNRLLGETNSRTQVIAQTALEVINSNNRPATTLGILTQGSRRQGVVPTVIRTLTRLWRFR